ncbi:hypothetical protein CWC48_29905 [Pseudomonas sp. S10E 269]|uniref:hypothetical protein n=1 Tax=unclassified Pseudomonas TaxID=196821 RepID=UPI000C269D9D|nr:MULTISPECIES: hypothetical protein [unclassified Pseudomonas]PJK31773.1 hypothetical protein CWC49_29950 [Pseudomonas sp. S09F 262]PJK37545.1 hypothetical protein CWC48_29905 [Pseudomonas sp. S10E 269]
MPRQKAVPSREYTDTLLEKQKAAALRRAEVRGERLKAKAEGKEYTPPKGGREYGQEQHRLMAERQYLELHTPVTHKADVVDIKGVWSRRTPKAQKSQQVHVLQQNIKDKPRRFDVMDGENYQFRPGVLHHGGFMSFDPDRQSLYGKDDLDKVKIFKSFKGLEELILESFASLITISEQEKISRVVGKCWAHAGSRFDWVGFALYLGIDKNSKMRTYITVNGRKRRIRWEIKSFSNKPRITLSCGKGGGIKYEMVDSYWLMPSKLKDLGSSIVKGELPTQFKDPISWMKERGHSVTLRDLRPYLVDAHLADLEAFKDRLSPAAYLALSDWKKTIDDIAYTQSDVVVLANALITYTSAYKELMEPLADFLGEEVMSTLHPLGYNTASTAGFALSMSYWYMSQYQRNPDGTYEIKDSLKHHFKETKIAAITSGGFPTILSDAQVAELIESGTELQRHGIMLRKNDVEYIVNPIFTNKEDNLFDTHSQFGGGNEGYGSKNYPGTSVEGLDINSAYALVAQSGVKIRPDVLGGKALNAGLGFQHHSYRTSYPTEVMIDSGLATKEKVINEHGEEVLAWVVRGRLKILKMLEFRSGTFTVQFSPSKSKFFNECPPIPFRTEGKGLDSRMIRPRFVEKTLGIVTASLLGYYCSYPTENDDDMVVYLCERGKDVIGEKTWLNRSRHAAILGIKAVVNNDAQGKPYVKVDGVPQAPLALFNSLTYALREKYRVAANDAANRGDLELAALLRARAQMIKMILTGGGYGSYAQGQKPERDINLYDLEDVIETIEILQSLDPEWSGVDEFVLKAQALIPKAQIADFSIEAGAKVGWPQLYRRLSFFLQQHEDLEERISKATDSAEREDLEHSLIVLKQKHSKVPDDLFRAWAAAQITTYSSYEHALPRRHGKAQVFERHGTLGLADSTSPHAQRPFASQITDKGQVLLFQLVEACHSAGYQLLSADTDGVKIGVPLLDGQGNRIGHDDIVKAIEASKLFKFGTGLGQLKFEDAIVREGLGTLDVGKKVEITHGFFLAPKVYFQCDEHRNLKSCAVRSVPRANAVHQGVLMGYSIGASGLGSKPGIQAESYRHVNLLESRDLEFAEETATRKRTVEALFQNPRRRYFDQYTSEPFEARMPESLKKKIAAGEKFSAATVCSAINREMSMTKDMVEIQGLLKSAREYKNTVRIAGESFYEQADKVQREIDSVKRAIYGNNEEDFEYDPNEFSPFHDVEA